MVDWLDLLLRLVSPAYTAIDVTTGETPVELLGDAFQTPLLGETHMRRAAIGGAALGAAALAPVIYPYVAPKARSKRKKAKQEKEAAAVKELGEITQKGISKAFTSAAFALPATFLLLEVLAGYPKASPGKPAGVIPIEWARSIEIMLAAKETTPIASSLI